jgi:hypothetical protein
LAKSSQQKDLVHQITSISSIWDENIENLKNLNFSHKENFGNFDM